MADRSAPYDPRREEPTVAWHALGPDDVGARLGVGGHGLSVDEARARLLRHGPNRIEEHPPPSLLALALRQFASPLIYILLAATAVTVALGEYLDAAVIATVLTLNAVIGFTQEHKAEGAVRALMQLVVPHARVMRGGQEWEIESTEVVPGDVVLLEPGSRVAADLRLTWTHALRVDESLLTGESVPVTKHTDAVTAEAAPADRTSMAFAGAMVTTGRGRGTVVATGGDTVLGATAELVQEAARPATPLQRRMQEFSVVVGVAVAVASVVAFVSGLARGESAHDMFLAAVALAVAAIPEGLPVAFTITLALGVHHMARRRAIVRRLPAVETLGSTTVIGSDKTGTLTENRMTVQAIWAGGHYFTVSSAGGSTEIFVDGESAAVDDHAALHRTLLAGVLTNEAEVVHGVDGTLEVHGDPTEAALVVAATGAGILADDAREAYPAVGEIPFEPDLRYSASVRSRDGRQFVYVKGAPERVSEMCAGMLTDEGAVVPVDRESIVDASAQMANESLRVLAMAYRPIDPPIDDATAVEEPTGLVFLGLQGMLDPPRPGVRDAVQVCHDAGIRVVMITGDHATTARSIAADLGIATSSAPVLTGAEISSLDDVELESRVARVSVFARVAPEEKLRIVRALEHDGEVVAVTGDGVNDAPALQAAAIGIAMGKGGTDVAREAADMVLADDNFVTIAAAVEEGRVTFDNIRKVTFFLVSTAAATILAILAGVWLGWPLLMLPAQLLWLNLVTNGLQDVALAFEPGEQDVLQRRPRSPREGVLSRVLWERTAVVGVVMAIGTLALFRWELDRTGDLTQARTVALTTMVVFMAFHAGNSRSETVSLTRLSPVSNRFLFVATLLAFGVHVLALSLPPTQYVLRVEPLDAATWVRMVLVASTLLVVVEVDKAIRRRLAGAGPVSRWPRRGGG